MRKSEILAADAVSCLNEALCQLKDIWEEIGIPEDQRLERTLVTYCNPRFYDICRNDRTSASWQETAHLHLYILYTSVKMLLLFFIFFLQLEEHKAENEATCEALREKIHQLWDRLQTRQVEREALNEHMVSSRKRNLETLQAEVQRLEELKLRNIRSVIDAIRSEIAVFWDKCLFSIDQRQAFVPYYCGDFNEELMALHDAEIQRLKRHYETHKGLFEGVQKWEENWKLFLELEKKATDPARFTNRGGNLLKEEKHRSELQKNFPKVRHEDGCKLSKCQRSFCKEEHSQEFTVNGQKFLQYVTQQWELHQVEKEKEKLERHMKKSKQSEEDMLYGTIRTPTKRRFVGTPTPNKTRKVEFLAELLTICFIFYFYCLTRSPSVPFTSSMLPARTPGAGRPPHPRVQCCNKENKPQQKGSPLSGVLQTPHRNFSIASVASTYSEFVHGHSNIIKSGVTTQKQM
uniref:Protein regulator of cytokinesis 1b n=1 Tax=Nothobranchius furzeri TaxID=105023 RepID=A0A8C6P3F7_NOTFU